MDYFCCHNYSFASETCCLSSLTGIHILWFPDVSLTMNGGGFTAVCLYPLLLPACGNQTCRVERELEQMARLPCPVGVLSCSFRST
ncbi:hypothetical protein MUK42_36401 [Musa troglodytarum]|uniref:Uncharacterized protein n=1 Tax=Musa troglodytarum TaxID=320322 RepID=A0A9E7EGN8_9LILI|nr:hypothetical protein MUK42_36401 [Musa troglodytarum]